MRPTPPRHHSVSRSCAPVAALLPVVALAMPAATVVASAPTSAHGAVPGAVAAPVTPGLAEVPQAPIVVPASGSVAPAGLRLARHLGSPGASAVSVAGVPDLALAAYQRASTVINAADLACALPWELLAAIGRVESNDGRAEANHLDARGVATPGIFGVPLDGLHGVAKVQDTDAGALDRDRRVDRAVGPMQFLPSTWSAVAVDADGDGLRDPQDIDDAALAAAVYLCSGPGDLATPSGQRAAVLRYNHSADYARVVLAIMRAYESGDFAAGLQQPLGGAAPTSAHHVPARHGHRHAAPAVVSPAGAGQSQLPHHAAAGDAPTSTPPAPDPAPAATPESPAADLLEPVVTIVQCGLDQSPASLVDVTALMDCMP